jgi:Flp pilus assembly protein TadG
MRHDRERGATSVEFALVVPLFLVLLGIAGYFAWQLYTESQLQRAAQRAARYAAVPTTDGAYAYRHCDVVGVVNDHLSSLSVPASSVEVSDADAPLAATTCPSTDTAGRPRGYVQVRVTHVLDNPFSDLLVTLLQRPGPMTITGSGEARVEDVS